MPRFFVLFRFLFLGSDMWLVLLLPLVLTWLIGWKGRKGRCLPAALAGLAVYAAAECYYLLPIQSYSIEFLIIFLGTFGLGAALGFLAAWAWGKLRGREPDAD